MEPSGSSTEQRSTGEIKKRPQRSTKSTEPNSGGYADYDGSRLSNPVSCPYCLEFSTHFPNTFDRHFKKCKVYFDQNTTPQSVSPTIISYDDGQETPIKIEMNQVSPPIKSEMDQEQLQQQSITFHSVQEDEDDDDEVQIISPPPVVEEKKKRKRRKTKVVEAELDVSGDESETFPKVNSKPHVSLLITSHCTQCPLCDFTTKYHFNIARHLYCMHKEDYALISQGKKSLEGIQRKEPGTVRRRSVCKPFQTRRNSKPETQKGPTGKKRGKTRIVQKNIMPRSRAPPPILVEQKMGAAAALVSQQFGHDGSLPVLDRYTSDLDIDAEFLNQASEPGSSSNTPQSPQAWEKFLENLDEQEQQQQQEAGASTMPNYMDVTNNMNLDMSINDQTDESLLQNSFLPNLPSSSLSTLPPISTFKNFPSLISPSLQNTVKQPNPDGRLMSPEQVEIRKKVVKEKAKEKRMEEKLMETSMPIIPKIENGLNDNESSFGQSEDTFPILSEPSAISLTCRLGDSGQSVSDGSQEGKPVKGRLSTEGRIKRPSEKVKNQTNSMDEKERIKKEKLREWRRNNYLKKKKLAEEKRMKEMASMDEETKMLHEKNQQVSEDIQRESMNNVDNKDMESTSTVNGDMETSRVKEEKDQDTSNFESSSVLQKPDNAPDNADPTLPQIELNEAERKELRKKEKLSQYRKSYYERKKKRLAEEREQRRRLILQQMQKEAPDDYNFFNDTSLPVSGRDYSTYLQPGELKSKKKMTGRRFSTGVESNASDKSWGDDEYRKRGKKSKMNGDGYSRMEGGESRQKKRRTSKEMTLGEVYHDSQMDDDDEYYDAAMTTDGENDYETNTVPAAPTAAADAQPEKKVEETLPPKLYNCTSCEFSTPNSFSLLIHTKIHETVSMLPQFFRNLISVNDNLKRLLSDDEPDVSRATKYFEAAGLPASAVEESSKKDML